jgi:hypothetical protein
MRDFLHWANNSPAFLTGFSMGVSLSAVLVSLAAIVVSVVAVNQ